MSHFLRQIGAVKQQQVGASNSHISNASNDPACAFRVEGDEGFCGNFHGAGQPRLDSALATFLGSGGGILGGGGGDCSGNVLNLIGLTHSSEDHPDECVQVNYDSACSIRVKVAQLAASFAERSGQEAAARLSSNGGDSADEHEHACSGLASDELTLVQGGEARRVSKGDEESDSTDDSLRSSDIFVPRRHSRALISESQEQRLIRETGLCSQSQSQFLTPHQLSQLSAVQSRVLSLENPRDKLAAASELTKLLETFHIGAATQLLLRECGGGGEGLTHAEVEGPSSSTEASVLNPDSAVNVSGSSAPITSFLKTSNKGALAEPGDCIGGRPNTFDFLGGAKLSRLTSAAIGCDESDDSSRRVSGASLLASDRTIGDDVHRESVPRRREEGEGELLRPQQSRRPEDPDWLETCNRRGSDLETGAALVREDTTCDRRNSDRHLRPFLELHLTVEQQREVTNQRESTNVEDYGNYMDTREGFVEDNVCTRDGAASTTGYVTTTGSSQTDSEKTTSACHLFGVKAEPAFARLQSGEPAEGCFPLEPEALSGPTDHKAPNSPACAAEIEASCLSGASRQQLFGLASRRPADEPVLLEDSKNIDVDWDMEVAGAAGSPLCALGLEGERAIASDEREPQGGITSFAVSESAWCVLGDTSRSAGSLYTTSATVEDLELARRADSRIPSSSVASVEKQCIKAEVKGRKEEERSSETVPNSGNTTGHRGVRNSETPPQSLKMRWGENLVSVALDCKASEAHKSQAWTRMFNNNNTNNSHNNTNNSNNSNNNGGKHETWMPRPVLAEERLLATRDGKAKREFSRGWSEQQVPQRASMLSTTAAKRIGSYTTRAASTSVQPVTDVDDAENGEQTRKGAQTTLSKSDSVGYGMAKNKDRRSPSPQNCWGSGDGNSNTVPFKSTVSSRDVERRMRLEESCFGLPSSTMTGAALSISRPSNESASFSMVAQEGGINSRENEIATSAMSSGGSSVLSEWSSVLLHDGSTKAPVPRESLLERDGNCPSKAVLVSQIPALASNHKICTGSSRGVKKLPHRLAVGSSTGRAGSAYSKGAPDFPTLTSGPLPAHTSRPANRDSSREAQLFSGSRGEIEEEKASSNNKAREDTSPRHKRQALKGARSAEQAHQSKHTIPRSGVTRKDSSRQSAESVTVISPRRGESRQATPACDSGLVPPNDVFFGETNSKRLRIAATNSPTTTSLCLNRKSQRLTARETSRDLGTTASWGSLGMVEYAGKKTACCSGRCNGSCVRSSESKGSVECQKNHQEEYSRIQQRLCSEELSSNLLEQPLLASRFSSRLVFRKRNVQSRQTVDPMGDAKSADSNPGKADERTSRTRNWMPRHALTKKAEDRDGQSSDVRLKPLRPVLSHNLEAAGSIESSAQPQGPASAADSDLTLIMPRQQSPNEAHHLGRNPSWRQLGKKSASIADIARDVTLESKGGASTTGHLPPSDHREASIEGPLVSDSAKGAVVRNDKSLRSSWRQSELPRKSALRSCGEVDAVVDAGASESLKDEIGNPGLLRCPSYGDGGPSTVKPILVSKHREDYGTNQWGFQERGKWGLTCAGSSFETDKNFSTNNCAESPVSPRLMKVSSSIPKPPSLSTNRASTGRTSRKCSATEAICEDQSSLETTEQCNARSSNDTILGNKKAVRSLSKTLNSSASKRLAMSNITEACNRMSIVGPPSGSLHSDLNSVASSSAYPRCGSSARNNGSSLCPSPVLHSASAENEVTRLVNPTVGSATRNISGSVEEFCSAQGLTELSVFPINSGGNTSSCSNSASFHSTNQPLHASGSRCSAHNERRTNHHFQRRYNPSPPKSINLPELGHCHLNASSPNYAPVCMKHSHRDESVSNGSNSTSRGNGSGSAHLVPGNMKGSAVSSHPGFQLPHRQHPADQNSSDCFTRKLDCASIADSSTSAAKSPLLMSVQHSGHSKEGSNSSRLESHSGEQAEAHKENNVPRRTSKWSKLRRAKDFGILDVESTRGSDEESDLVIARTASMASVRMTEEHSMLPQSSVGLVKPPALEGGGTGKAVNRSTVLSGSAIEVPLVAREALKHQQRKREPSGGESTTAIGEDDRHSPPPPTTTTTGLRTGIGLLDRSFPLHLSSHLGKLQSHFQSIGGKARSMLMLVTEREEGDRKEIGSVVRAEDCVATAVGSNGSATREFQSGNSTTAIGARQRCLPQPDDAKGDQRSHYTPFRPGMCSDEKDFNGFRRQSSRFSRRRQRQNTNASPADVSQRVLITPGKDSKKDGSESDLGLIAPPERAHDDVEAPFFAKGLVDGIQRSSTGSKHQPWHEGSQSCFNSLARHRGNTGGFCFKSLEARRPGTVCATLLRYQQQQAAVKEWSSKQETTKDWRVRPAQRSPDDLT